MNIPTTCPRCQTSFNPEVSATGESLCPRCMMKFLISPDSSASTPTVLAPDSRVGTPFRNLDVLSILGRGGMGVVYRARQRDLGRTVALKLLAPELARMEEFVARFKREAQAMSALSHPNIVSVLEFGFEEGLPYLVMEYVEGENLRKLLAEKRLSTASALRLIPQICEALDYAHARGIVHRDIKPENILVAPDGRLKIADFGLARLSEAGPALTRSDAMMGTPHYMAPEQVENPKSVDHRADIYSLGVVFYEMLTGELPIGSFQPPSSRADVSPLLDRIVMKALSKEPRSRYQRAGDVRADVARVPGGGTGVMSPWRTALFIGSSLPFIVMTRALFNWEWWQVISVGVGIALADALVILPARFPGWNRSIQKPPVWMIAMGLAVGVASMTHALVTLSLLRVVFAVAGLTGIACAVMWLAMRLHRHSFRWLIVGALSLLLSTPFLGGVGWILSEEISKRSSVVNWYGHARLDLDKTQALRLFGAPDFIDRHGPVESGYVSEVLVTSQGEIWCYGRSRLLRYTDSFPFVAVARDRSMKSAPWDRRLVFNAAGRVVNILPPEQVED